ncbi:MAG TPA: ATP-binding cassette domain-containing protein, partial [Acidimicrobiales bacterium]|nr:ATP-binding cassette domain-containing protein [Acidimicrobiales bacterium]
SFFDTDARRAFASALAAEEWRRARQSGKGKLLVCRDVDVAYDGVQVLFGVDFDVEENEIIALLGTNGAGKSTLLRAICGSQEASGGAIVFDGRDTTHMPPHEIAGRGVICMPGGRGVFPGLSVRENLMLANWLVEDPAEARASLEEVYEIFPVLRERAGLPANSLSGGEQQQLSLAQAFLSKPRLLMIDELSLGLSPAVVAQLLDIVREIHRRGVTVIIVEQSVNVALTIAEKAIFMEKGEVKFFGNTADLLARPDILRAVYVKGTGALMDRAPAAAQRSERQRREMGLAEVRNVLEVEGLIKSYGGVHAVDDVSLALREGEVLGLIGPNGAGKTTIFDMISGFTPIDAGVVRYDGVDITDLSPDERARRGLVRRFQDARLFSSLTVFETLLVSLEQRLEVKSAILNAAAWPQARRAERRLHIRANQLVELFELGAYRDKFVKELSTGLRRILDLACVLATSPKVLLLDEPSSGIAQAEAESLAPLLRRIRVESGCSIMIIEHDMTLISSVSDELIALDRGAVVLRGQPDAVLNDERVIESYLGTSEDVVARSGRR